MDATPPMSYPREKGSPVHEMPLESEGPIDFFPNVCLRSHWDPTAILQRTLPAGYVAQPLDPRPWTRICMEYTTAGEQEQAPTTNPAIVMPGGGGFYPPDKYMAAIDTESKLRALDRPLGISEKKQWTPNEQGDMFNSQIIVSRPAANPAQIEELAYPRALLRTAPYDCREMNDQYNVAVTSDYIFNNATKQDRYKQMNKPYKPAPASAPIQAAVERIRSDLDFSAAPVETPGTYEKLARNQRQELILGVEPVPTGASKYDTHFAPRG